MPGIGVVGGVCALGVPGCAPGVVEDFTDKGTGTIRNRADAPQLVTIEVAHHAIILHRNALPIGIVVTDVHCDRVGDKRKICAISLCAGLKLIPRDGN